MGRDDSPRKGAEEIDDAHAGTMGDAMKSVEELMQRATTPIVPKAVSPTKRQSAQDDADCLEEVYKEKKVQVTYRPRSTKEVKKGFTFGAIERSTHKEFVTPDLTNDFLLGKDSPGPIYNTPSFTDHPTRPQSFAKAQRTQSRPEEVPGPQYDIPSSMGRQLARESAPVTKIGQAPRFIEGQYLSKEHSEGLMNRTSPAPGAYSPELPRTAPSFSFSSGNRDVKQGKLFLSRGHAQHDGIGMASPGPVYDWPADLVQKKGPSFTFGGPGPLSPSSPQSRSPSRGGSWSPTRSPRDGASTGVPQHSTTEPTSFRDITMGCPGKDSPGPGKYTPSHALLEPTPPSFSLASQETATNRFYSRDLIQPGGDSPGPLYKPDCKQTWPGDKGPVFAGKDPAIAATLPRFSDKQFLSQQLAFNEMAGRSSPGPAAYDVAKWNPSGPAYSMGRKEKLLMKRISPGPERARYLSSALMKENLGTFSPGPKYRMPDCIGAHGTVKYSFGMSDRTYEDIAIELKEKLGTIEKPYTAPCEARYHGADLHKSQMVGKFSPGPKYNIKHDLVTKRSPAHAIGGKWKVKETPKPSREEVEEDIKRAKSKSSALDITVLNTPSIRFGTSKRGVEEAKSRSAVGRDSPGPVYCPNFEAVLKKTSAPTIGGLH